MKKITVVIVDDHPVVRHGVASILAKERDMDVVGESEGAATAIPLIKEFRPDAVILDISMAGVNGIDLIPSIKALVQDTAIIIYSMHHTRDHIFRAFKAGAMGYVLKADSTKALIDAIRKTVQREIYLSTILPPAIAELLHQGTEDPGALSSLSPRENEIATLLAQGLTPDEIGTTLFISPKTVRVHRTNIMKKLTCKRFNTLLLLLRDHYTQQASADAIPL